MAKKNKYTDWTKEDLVKRIVALEKHRYGLVWEDKREDVAEQCDRELPVLYEDTSREIKSKEGLPQNILIEGDNYHALYTLSFTHKKKIDVIYIDPPYNTGKAKEWKYNDRYVDINDTYRHSKWLSFMHKRLRLAKNLLRETGILIISIDDNEIMNLRMLCDKIFQEKNHVATLPTIMNLKGNQDQFGFAGAHEYTLVYAKDKKRAKINEFLIDDEEFEKWQEDDWGLFKKGAPLRATGEESNRADRAKMFYPILVDRNTLAITTHISDEEYERIYNKESDTFDDKYLNKLCKKYSKQFYFVLPYNDDGTYSRWRWGWSFLNRKKMTCDVIVNTSGKSITLYKKQRPEISDLITKKPKTIFYKPEYSSSTATSYLKKMFDNLKVINNPKPIELLKDIIHLTGNKTSLILDFFAGSGTTGHAVLELNLQDNGQRQFILCTNNENNICEEVTYPRIKKVIEGYNCNKPILANLKYFKTEFVPQVITDNNKRILVNRSTELLCLAENTFELLKRSKRKLEYAIYRNTKQLTAIIYDEDAIEKCKEELEELKPRVKTIIYVFSYDHEYDEEDFDDLSICFEVKPIPEAILNVYRKNARLKRK